MFEKKMKNLLLVQMVWRFFGWTPFDHGLLICVYLESGDLSRMEAYADSYGLSLEWRPSFSCWKALNKKRRTKKQRRRTRRRNFSFFFSCFSPTCLLIVVVDDFPVFFWGPRVKILKKSFHFVAHNVRKLLKKVALEFFNFGIFYQFLSF